jgi:mannose-6-phosphate isomerase-like protein (cupin superfamily)
MMNGTTSRPLLRRPGEGEALWFADNHMTIKARAADTGGAYGLLESHVRAGSGPPLHVHHREDEAFWILGGELTVVCGGEELRAGPGSYVFLPRDVPHTFKVTSATDAHLLTLLSPGGGEQFFVAGGVPAESAGLPAHNVTDIPTMLRIAADYGTEIVGPPLP